jgi:hypothetical protein
MNVSSNSVKHKVDYVDFTANKSLIAPDVTAINKEFQFVLFIFLRLGKQWIGYTYDNQGHDEVLEHG